MPKHHPHHHSPKHDAPAQPPHDPSHRHEPVLRLDLLVVFVVVDAAPEQDLVPDDLPHHGGERDEGVGAHDGEGGPEDPAARARGHVAHWTGGPAGEFGEGGEDAPAYEHTLRREHEYERMHIGGVGGVVTKFMLRVVGKPMMMPCPMYERLGVNVHSHSFAR